MNTLRRGQGLSALNAQETKRKKTKPVAGKNTLGACKCSFTVSHACHLFGAAGEGCSRTSPSPSLSESGNAFPLQPWSPTLPPRGCRTRLNTTAGFFLQGRCQPAKKKEIMEPARFPALPARSNQQPQKGRATASHEHCKCFQQIALRTTGAVKHRKLEGKRGEGRFANLVSPLENDQNLHS